jgi:hypothetical protein
MATATINAEAMNTRVLPVVGFTQEQLQAAFSKVQDKADWKAPIFASVAMDELAVTMLAVEFFTATKAEVQQLMSCGNVLIFAKGYRNGPAC